MFPSTNTQYGSTENITISTEDSTIPAFPSPFSNRSVLETKIQAMFHRFEQIQNKIDNNSETFDKQHEELVNLKSETIRLS